MRRQTGRQRKALAWRSPGKTEQRWQVCPQGLRHRREGEGRGVGSFQAEGGSWLRPRQGQINDRPRHKVLPCPCLALPL